MKAIAEYDAGVNPDVSGLFLPDGGHRQRADRKSGNFTAHLPVNIIHVCLVKDFAVMFLAEFFHQRIFFLVEDKDCFGVLDPGADQVRVGNLG